MKKSLFLILSYLLFTSTLTYSSLVNNFLQPDTLKVNHVEDFELDGKGGNSNWAKSSWQTMTQLDSGLMGYNSQFKIMYSAKGVYVLFTGNDQKITSDFTKDFENLFMADVFEVFFHPEPKTPLYLEYEVNANNLELVLLIPNLKNKINGWAPWHYTGNRKVTKMVFVHKQNELMYKWTAELFFPLELFSPLENTNLIKGTCWNANFYRLDYDAGKMVKFAWSPVKSSFHEIDKFGVIQFN